MPTAVKQTLGKPTVTSQVVVYAGNGYGSSNVRIRRFQTIQINTGTGIVYADSASLGATFTIAESGLYAIHYVDRSNSATGVPFGVSLNANLSSDVDAIDPTQRIMLSATGNSNTAYGCSTVVELTAGDVLRAHSNSGSKPDSTGNGVVVFRIIQLAKY